MTAINNHLTLIEQVGGIEKAKAIVEGAPNGADSFVIIEHYRASSWFYGEIWLNNLRTAIAQHDTTDHITDIRNHISPNTKVVEL